MPLCQNVNLKMMTVISLKLPYCRCHDSAYDGTANVHKHVADQLLKHA